MQNKLTKIMGFSFTHFMEDALTKKGFNLSLLRKDEDKGLEYQQMHLHAPDNSTLTIEFANILDDEDFRNYAKKNFPQGHNPTFPQMYIANPSVAFIKASGATNIFFRHDQEPAPMENEIHHKNGAFKLKTLIWKKQLLHEQSNAELLYGNGILNHFMEPSDPLFQYFKIRKESDLCALVLTCKNLDHFISISNPDDIITWQNKKVAHLKEGPNLFDFLIMED